jgi:ribosomal-protein-alanine N-acetyltransferase
MAGRGFVPTAVALIGDHCVSEMQLHRIEINIRPENVASLAVVRKLGFRDEGLRPRYLHIDGDWRDHQSFALTVEDLGDSTLMERLAQSSQPSLWRHTDGGPPA